MRWGLFIILAWLVILMQITILGLIRIPIESLGVIMPDLMAGLAVFVVLRGKRLANVLIAVWILGLIVDLTNSSGAGQETVLGPMPIAYVLSAWIIFQAREVFFREWIITQVLLAFAFTLLAHLVWVTWQCLAARDATTWQDFGHLIVQAGLLAAYTAVITPVMYMLLKPCQRFIFADQSGRSSRRRWG
ncbi:MAG TPA: hypothetical protein ENL03_06170 [Phycisphaerae bacterium]|nr:hypothetical protein [Phycisphaerae bacterium]